MNLENTKFIGVGRNVQPLPWRMKCHTHPFHEMILVVSGEQYVAIAEKEIRAKDGDILFYPKNVPHEEWTVPGQPLVSSFISFHWSPTHTNTPTKIHDRLGRIHVLMEWLLSEIKAHSTLTPILTQTIFQTLLAQFQSLWIRKEEDFVETVRHHVRKAAASAITLDSLANIARMSKFHFARKFKKQTGRTPMEDVRAIRVDYARNLVLTTSLPLKLIAETSGLGDPYHLSRLFRQILGATPGSLRRQTRLNGRN